MIYKQVAISYYRLFIDMEDKYKAFHHYDFHHDDSFLKGWDCIKGNIADNTDKDVLKKTNLQARIFYFSR